jgi:hypothetical protein rflaF_17157
VKAKLSYPVALLLIALANAIAGVVCISLLPESVAVHFNLSFEVDRLGSPWIYLTFFLFPPLVAAGLLFESLRRGQKEKNRKPLKIILTFIAAMLAYIGWLMVGWCGSVSELGQKAEAPLPFLICTPIGAAFIVLGNYLPVIKRNSTLGIKTPSTLASDYVWTQTHRVMGKVWVGMGVGEILCALIDTFAGTEFLAPVWLAAAIAAECISLPFVTRRFKKRELQALSENAEITLPSDTDQA